MEKLTILLMLLINSACSNLSKTLIYSGSTGAVVGAIAGKKLSPDRESNTFNTILGATTGAALSMAASYYFYKDSRVDLELKNSPLKSEAPLMPITDHSFGMDQIKILPKITALGAKEYLKISDDTPIEFKDSAKKQYFRRFRTSAYNFNQDGKTYLIPSFEIIENGVENDSK